MTCHADALVPTKGVLSNAFTIALLLSGGVQRAEAALLDSIREMAPGQVSDDALLIACVKHATMLRPGDAANIEPVESASSLLPRELIRILLLPAYFRHSFVLRVLLKLSLEECARLNIRNANQGASAAARELARIREDERSYSSEKVVGINHWIS